MQNLIPPCLEQFIRKRIFFYFFFLIIIAFLVILFIIYVYNPIPRFFSSYAEAEIQTYFFIFILIFTLFSILNWTTLFSTKKLRKNITKLIVPFCFLLPKFKNPNDSCIKLTKLFFLSLILMELIYLGIFITKGYYNPEFITALHITGLFTGEYFKLIEYIKICIFLMLLYCLFIFTKRNARKAGLIFYCLALFLITVLSLNIGNLNFYDYSYYAGPVNDLLHGKFLLHNNISQYGFFSIIFLSLPFYFLDLNLTNLTILNLIVIILSYLAILAICISIYKDKYFALFVLIVIIFANHITGGMGYYVQTNALRFGMWVLISLSVINEIKMQNTKYYKISEMLTLTLISFSFFWILDNGVYIILAYLFYRVFNSLDNISKTINTLKSVLLKIAISILIIFLLIQIFYISVLNVYPNWNFFVSHSVYYLSTFGLMPFPNSSWPWFFIIIYILGLCLLFTYKKFKRKEINTLQSQLFTFILFYGIFQFTYFMGRSHINNLHHISAPFIIGLFYLILIVIQSIKHNPDKLIKLQVGIILSLGFALPFYFLFMSGIRGVDPSRIIHIQELVRKIRKYEEIHLNEILGEDTIKRLNDNSDSGYSQYLKTNGVTLLSIFDTWYLIKLDMVNNIQSNNLLHYIDEGELKWLAGSVVRQGDKYIFLDKDKTREGNKIDFLFKRLSEHYKFKENIGELDVYERI